MGAPKKDITIAQQFHKDLDMASLKFSGQDVIVIGDFNAKNKNKDFAEGPIGSHARGIRNENGELLQDSLPNNRMFASNSFLKHKACKITTPKAFLNTGKISIR